MKLLLVGRAGARASDWSGYALLRDNVQHFIEGGEPSERFAALHAIEKAVDHGACVVDAARLRGEVMRAWYALWGISLDRAAVSLRTRAILTGSPVAPSVRRTVAAQLFGWELPVAMGAPARVAETAGRFVAAVLALTEDAVDGDRVEVRRYGPPPRFAARRVSRARAPGAAGRPSLTGLALKAMSIAVLAVACSGSTPRPETPAQVEGDQDSTTNLEQRNPEEDRGPIVAPPPGYGNKVVLLPAARPPGQHADDLAAI